MSRMWDNVRDYGVGTHSLSAETIGTTMHGGIVAMSAVLKLRGFVWRTTLLHVAQRFAGGKVHQAYSNGSITFGSRL